MAKRPSGIAPNRVGVRGLSWEVDVDRELAVHPRGSDAGEADRP